MKRKANINKYRLVEKLGNDTHGNVYLMENNSERPKLIVWKSVSLKNLKYAENEITIIRSLSNKRIVKFYDSFSNNKGRYIMMEYANYGDVERLISFMKMEN